MTSVHALLAVSPETLSQLASALQAAAAVVALIVGGIWTYRLFIENRMGGQPPGLRTRSPSRI